MKFRSFELKNEFAFRAEIGEESVRVSFDCELKFAFVCERVAESLKVGGRERRSGRRGRPSDVFELRVIRTKEDDIGRRVDGDEGRLGDPSVESEGRFANAEDSAERENAIQIRSGDDVLEREVANLAELTVEKEDEWNSDCELEQEKQNSRSTSHVLESESNASSSPFRTETNQRSSCRR